MTKKLKIWLGIFLAMFVVPEVLWSPVGNFIYSFITDHPFRDNFFMHSDNRSWLIVVNSLQFFGLIIAAIFLSAHKLYKKFRNGRVVLFLIFSFLVANFIVLYAIIATLGYWS